MKERLDQRLVGLVSVAYLGMKLALLDNFTSLNFDEQNEKMRVHVVDISFQCSQYKQQTILDNINGWWMFHKG